MRAITYTRYGPPAVLHLSELARPTPGPDEILVQVAASSVTTADMRLRAAAFPGVMQLPGRLMFGLFKPRKPVLGGDFAGTVAAIGADVTRFAPGDRVFGFSGLGAHADALTIRETAAVHPTPATLDDEQAAALPFGALSALVFLRDFAGLRAGLRVLILGASGGVGCYAVQIARAMGAEVTGVASAPHLGLLRDLGADQTIDYRSQDPLVPGAGYDLIFDTVGAADFRRARPALAPRGLFLPLNWGLREIGQTLATRLLRTRRRIRIGVSGDTAADLAELARLLAAGQLRPVIDSTYPLEQVAAAHAHVDTRHRAGAVVLRHA